VIRTWSAALGIACALAFMTTHGVVVVTGESMRPALARGDLAVYRRTRTVPDGAVVVYARDGGGLVAHRVIATEKRGALRTKGDANRTADFTSVTADRIHGRIILRIPSGALAGGLGHKLCYTSQSVAQ
jgi:signal peptidase I